LLGVLGHAVRIKRQGDIDEPLGSANRIGIVR
jgi:hypothetical protein